jgi:hypothetical protein
LPGAFEARESLQTALGSPVVVDRVVLSLSTRNAPPLYGVGLIDALPEATFENAALQHPVQIRGRVHRLKNGQIGRFGWKAQVATLDDFILTACANELGLKVPAHHQAASLLKPDAGARALDMIGRNGLSRRFDQARRAASRGTEGCGTDRSGVRNSPSADGQLIASESPSTASSSDLPFTSLARIIPSASATYTDGIKPTCHRSQFGLSDLPSARLAGPDRLHQSILIIYFHI